MGEPIKFWIFSKMGEAIMGVNWGIRGTVSTVNIKLKSKRKASKEIMAHFFCGKKIRISQKGPGEKLNK